jgi:hypothetical protein
VAATVALGVVRRAIVEGVPVSREALGKEASFILDASPPHALAAVDATARRLGIASLL